MFFSFKTLFTIVLAFLFSLSAAALPISHSLRRRCNVKQSQPSAVSASSASRATPSAVIQAASAAKSSSAATKASSTASSAAKSSSTASSKSSISKAVAVGSLAALFPVDSSSSWTTSTLASDALPLADSTFQVEKDITALTHSYIDAPDGKKSMQAKYPKGSYTFDHDPQGGISFYASGPNDVDLTTAKEATFAYSVYFPEGFQFNKGGKLPGLYGGNSAEVAVSCSGGRRSTDCFSARLMWRTDGAGELYTYLPDPSNSGFSGNENLCNVAPYSTCNPTYGASVGRGSFDFATGGWTTISERVRLNDVGESNGELQLFINGESVINVSGLKMRDDSGDGKIRGIQMQTFFGGHDSSYASPSDQEVFFSDFSVAITETL